MKCSKSFRPASCSRHQKPEYEVRQQRQEMWHWHETEDQKREPHDPHGHVIPPPDPDAYAREPASPAHSQQPSSAKPCPCFIHRVHSPQRLFTLIYARYTFVNIFVNAYYRQHRILPLQKRSVPRLSRFINDCREVGSNEDTMAFSSGSFVKDTKRNEFFDV